MGSIHIQFRATPELAKVLPGLDTLKGPQIRDQLIAKATGNDHGSILPANDAVYSLAKRLILLMIRAGLDSDKFDVAITDAEVQPFVDELDKEGQL